MARVQRTQTPEATPKMWTFILTALEPLKGLTRGLTLGDLCPAVWTDRGHGYRAWAQVEAAG